MLHSSQIENPRCSAKIDQMRLRRATNLPVVSQNLGSSGCHSEIQVGLRSLIDVSLFDRDGTTRTIPCERHSKPCANPYVAENTWSFPNSRPTPARPAGTGMKACATQNI